MKKALITGVSGQDGSYLSELLLAKGYKVHGMVRRSSSILPSDLTNLQLVLGNDNFSLHFGDLEDYGSLHRLICELDPDEIYNLAAQSDVKISFDIPEYTADTTGLGILRILEVIKNERLSARVYQAGSSEMFGGVNGVAQDEKTPFYPRSPYGAAKVYAHSIATNYREAYDIYVCNGILFNHESPRRGKNFVTRKITNAVAAIKLGLQNKLELGNLSAKRDWGYAKEYMDAIWLMMQQERPDDFVIASGKCFTVEDFCKVAFGVFNLNYQDYIEINEQFFRPTEVDVLIGDATKAKQKLGWAATTALEELAEIMVKSDYDCLKK